jgi:hypothetical protein
MIEQRTGFERRVFRVAPDEATAGSAPVTAAMVPARLAQATLALIRAGESYILAQNSFESFSF